MGSSLKDDYKIYGQMAGKIREIYYNSGGYRFKPKYESSIARGERGCWLEDGGDCEIVGNIYDHPELLKKGRLHHDKEP